MSPLVGSQYRAQISGRQTPGLTRGSPPFYITNAGGEPRLNPGFGVLRCGPRATTEAAEIPMAQLDLQSKLATLRCENGKIRHENKIY
jgi:hypothetical protein